MRRDMEYCIEILKDLSEGKYKDSLVTNKAFKNHVSDEEVLENKRYLYHLEILKNAGFISFNLTNVSGGCIIFDCPIITWDGNDFLDMTENKGLWANTKEAVKEKGFEIANMPLDLIVAFTKAKAKEMLGIDI